MSASENDSRATAVPLIVISKSAEETEIADALLAGAQDMVSVGQTQRLLSVAERELRTFRLETALNQTAHTLASPSHDLDNCSGFIPAGVTYPTFRCRRSRRVQKLAGIVFRARDANCCTGDCRLRTSARADSRPT